MAPGAYCSALTRYGADISMQAGPVGTAAEHKLLRSVFYKGTVAAVVEVLAAARAAGWEDWLREHLRAELSALDADSLDRFVDGSTTHARRSADKMGAAAAHLEELGVVPRGATAARNLLLDLDAQTMIIDCHGHYTTAPEAHTRWREQQEKAFASGTSAPAYPSISDDELRETLETGQLRLMRERGVDLTVFSPRASAMGHHVGDEAVSLRWTEVSNDLIARVVGLYPQQFVGVCQLPQSPGARPASCVRELRRAVEELGFIGCNLNPDPSGGHWSAPPLTDRSWYPLYEAMCELDVPAMVHVSAVTNASFHATGSHYLNADTTAFMQFLTSDLFTEFPDLRFVIPHGGGAVPYHWGRFRGLADMLGRPALTESVMRNVFFDTCVYHQAGIDLLFSVIDIGNLLFGSEMIGAVRGIDPQSGHHFDDTRRYVENLCLPPDHREKVYAGNAQRVYPRLSAVLADRALTPAAG